MGMSAYHVDVSWCVVGDISILYHANISVNTSVTYDERTVFGSHGAYAVWTGTAPRSVSISANLVGANSSEIQFNVQQVLNAYNWTQQSPPPCKKISAPAPQLTDMSVRIESFDSSIDEGVLLDGSNPIQISLSLSLKECKPI
jgi:hypothetical protein